MLGRLDSFRGGRTDSLAVDDDSFRLLRSACTEGYDIVRGAGL